MSGARQHKFKYIYDIINYVIFILLWYNIITGYFPLFRLATSKW